MAHLVTVVAGIFEKYIGLCKSIIVKVYWAFTVFSLETELGESLNFQWAVEVSSTILDAYQLWVCGHDFFKK